MYYTAMISLILFVNLVFVTNCFKPTDFVNTYIGTSKWTNKDETSTESFGNTHLQVGIPMAHSPFSPQTRANENKCESPYYYNDEYFKGFRKTHWMSGSCVVDYGTTTILPSTSLNISDALYALVVDHEEEVSTPSYYNISFKSIGLAVEATSANYVGVLHFDISSLTSDKFYIIVTSFDTAYHESYLSILDNYTMQITNPAHRIYQGSGSYAGIDGNHYVQFFNKPISYGVIGGDGSIRPYQLTGSSHLREQDSVAAYFEFETPVSGFESSSQPQDYHVYVAVSSSFVSCAGAKNNLIEEINHRTSYSFPIKDEFSISSIHPPTLFNDIKTNVTDIWNERLGRMEVSNHNAKGDDAYTIFYTALWHSLLLPRIASDFNGEYIAFDSHINNAKVMKADGYLYMDDYSMWDIFRALIPLSHLIYTDHTVDMVKSLVSKSEQGAWMPIFPAWNSYTSEMVGDHCCVLIADALHKQVNGLDFTEENAMIAFKYCKKSALLVPSTAEKNQGKGRKGIESYLSYGYIPLEDTMPEAPHPNQQVSRTLEYAYNDYVLSQWGEALFSLHLGKTWQESEREDVNLLLQHSFNFRNVFDSSVGFVRGRYKNATWSDVGTFDPTFKYTWLTETDVWQYTWNAPHNIEDLIHLYGGNVGFLSKLNEFFDEFHYNHGNEPDHHAAYMYAYVNSNNRNDSFDDVDNEGGSWKTQAIVRNIIEKEYTSTPGGLSGNDDAGQMSAWYVLSAVGLYQVCPGCGGHSEYVITSPLFDSTVLTLPNGKKFILDVTHESNSTSDVYIQWTMLNNEPYNCSFIAHKTVMKGGKLVMHLGSLPNKHWGSVGRACLRKESE